MKDKINRKPYIIAKLTFFDWAWADNIIFKIKAKSTEKKKGLFMIERIKELFGISDKDFESYKRQEEDEEINRIKWTRDEKGNIVSPFRSKKINTNG